MEECSSTVTHFIWNAVYRLCEHVPIILVGFHFFARQCLITAQSLLKDLELDN